MKDGKNNIYELIIIGAGPAGMTAAVYASRKRMNFLLISRDIGGQAAWSGDIENYTGYQFITGPELTLKFQEHINAFGIEVLMPEAAREVKKKGNLIAIVTDKAEYQAKSVIIATGKRPRELGIEGEKEFKNKGLTYCATCDGPLFKDKQVAVVGGGNSALDAVLQLMKISPKVYLLSRGARLSADKVMVKKAQDSPVVEILYNTELVKVFGDIFVKGVEVKQEGRRFSLDVEGVFVEIGLIPNSECAVSTSKNEKGEIIVDTYNRTNAEGIFAAGDVSSVPEKQIIIACGEGSKACLSAFRYLSTHNI